MKKYISKTLCWVLICAMLLAQIMIPGYADTATRTVYIDIAGSGWSSVNVYAWNDDGPCTGEWPGTPMIKKSGNIYYFDVPAVAQYIIFNDGTEQTIDLLLPADGKNMFSFFSGSWGSYTVETGTTRPIYVDITGFDWSNVNVYTWNDSGVCTGEWPGTPMTKVRDNVYCYEIPTDAVSVIFNDGTSQTSDLIVPNDGRDLYNHMQNSWSSYDTECIHSYTDEITLAASCTQNGLRTYTCSLCGLHYTESIPATGHQYSWRPTANPGCDTEGIKTYICDFCGDSYTERIPATGHSWAYGRCTTCGVVCDHNWIDGICKTCSSACGHKWSNGTCLVCKLVCYHSNWVDGACIHCSMTCSHDFKDGFCTVCGMSDANQDKNYCLVGFINGANYGCEDDYTNIGEYILVNGKLTATFTTDSYIFIKTTDNTKWYLAPAYCEDTICTFVENGTEKLLVPGNVELNFTITENADGSVTLQYAPNCDHRYTSEMTTSPTCTQGSVTTYTCSLCGHSYTEVGTPWDHNYVNGICTMCGGADPNYVVPTENIYLVGFINGANHGCEEDSANMGDYKFVDGKLVVTFTQDSYVFLKKEGNAAWYMSYTYSTGPKCNFYNNASNFVREKMLIPGGVEVTIYLSAGAGDSYLLSYTTPQMVCPHENHDLDGICTACGQQLTHLYVDGFCACGKAETIEPPVEYFLFGYINGANYACEEDAANMGQYKFVDGKLVAVFTEDSYVGVKTTGNADWFMTNGYTGQYAVARLYNTKTLGNPDKLYVPGGLEVTFTLVVNWDNTLSLSYTTAEIESSMVPTLTLKAPTLEFKDMITVNAFYTAENIDDVVEMGMITYSSKVDAWSVETADHVIPGATYEASSGRYYSCSQGIHAKFLGDTVYLAVYAKLQDGTYAYSKLASYSAVQYATNQLKNSTDTKLKQLVAAMLNYGAEAQLYFGHNTSALANASMTAEQKALPAAYSSSMVSSVPAASATKQGSFANNQGFASRKPAISFEGAFCINYFFTPNYAPDNGITLYYWDAADYNAASVLTTANATGSLKLEGSGTGEYRGDITGISAKDLSAAVYVAAVYTSGGTTWTSGVLGYSIGAYCSSQAPKGSDIAGLAKATAVYGYHAEAYFG